jgi:hypothetical protein
MNDNLTATTAIAVFPVSVDIVRNRFQAAFASTIRVSKGFLFASTKYIGRLVDNRLEIEYTSYGRATMRYHIYGYLFVDPRGSRLELMIREKYAWKRFIPSLFVFVLCTAGGLFYGTKGFISGAIGILLGSFLTLVLGGLCEVLAEWHRKAAANELVSLLQIIVSEPLRNDDKLAR